MTKESIIEAREYLSVKTSYGFRRILDVRSLFEGYNDVEVIKFLKNHLREKEKALKNMILVDKSHPRVDHIVAAMFRINMAIRTIEESQYRKEVTEIEGTQQGTEESGRFHKRDSGGHRGPGIGQDARHDGKDREPGQAVQRAA